MNFVDVLKSNHIEVKKGAGKGEIKICCLFCTERGETEDTRFRLGINIHTQLASCFNCGFSSRKITSVILRKLKSDVAVEKAVEVEEEKEVIKLPDGFEYLNPDINAKQWYLKKALKYLTERKLPKWQITAKKIGVTMIGPFAYRIIFPVVHNKELVGLVGRGWTKSCKPKYLNSVGDKYLYNCPQLKDIETIVLSEGIFKALKIERATKLASAALLGHSLSDLHLKQLSRYKKLSQVIIFSDPDKIGIKGTIDICQKLQESNYKVYTVTPNKQADELSDKVVRDLIHMAVKFSPLVEARMRAKAAFL